MFPSVSSFAAVTSVKRDNAFDRPSMTATMNIDYETLCLCALNTIFGYEPGIASALLENLGSASAVFALDDGGKDELFGPFSKYKGKICSAELDRAAGMLEALGRAGTVFVGRTQPGYPARLLECPDAPVGLFVRSCEPPEKLFGNDGMNIAVVGTREITKYGEQWCEEIVRGLADTAEKPRIISGLAYGTDILAHRTAVGCGLGTIAVMATGPDEVYPSRHRGFALGMAETPGCALVTDYPAHTAPLAVNFIRRNRIIAGLSDSIVLVESAVKGGGMITCRMAFSYDRAVYALPGRGDDSRSQGCNRLIAEGVAQIIESVDALRSQLGLSGLSGFSRAESGEPDTPVVQLKYSGILPRDKVGLLTDILLKIRQKRGISIDELCEEISVPRRVVTELTSLLEADGFISVDLLQRCTLCRS